MSGIDCVNFQLKPIPVGTVGLINFGTIYGVVPNLGSCNQNDATLSNIKKMICADPNYKDDWMCRCINYQNNRSSLIAQKQCSTVSNNSELCKEITQNMMCSDPYCINPYPNILKTTAIKEQWDFNKNGDCSKKKGCRTLVNIEGLKDSDLTKNVCQTSTPIDNVQTGILLIINIVGLGVVALLLALYMFYFFQK